jgi:hypothetical protein
MVIGSDMAPLVSRDNFTKRRSRPVTHFTICRNKNVYFLNTALLQPPSCYRANSGGKISNSRSI